MTWNPTDPTLLINILAPDTKTMPTSQAKTTITFDCTLISPEGLRTMAREALAKRDEMDGVSAAHYIAWNNLAGALQVKACRLREGPEQRGVAMTVE